MSPTLFSSLAKSLRGLVQNNGCWHPVLALNPTLIIVQPLAPSPPHQHRPSIIPSAPNATTRNNMHLISPVLSATFVTPRAPFKQTSRPPTCEAVKAGAQQATVDMVLKRNPGVCYNVVVLFPKKSCTLSQFCVRIFYKCAFALVRDPAYFSAPKGFKGSRVVRVCA